MGVTTHPEYVLQLNTAVIQKKNKLKLFNSLSKLEKEFC